jgi:adenosylcobyric acid synthase
MTALLIAGTTSDAGKSLVTAALCRALARRGVSVAPFKAQNMSNNSMVVGVGDAAGEIGRAQWVQALAAGVQPEVGMNPVLLKPGGDQHSHVVVNGKPAGTISSSEFIGGRAHLAETAFAAFDELAARFDVVVCEGAGSPAEINLRTGDYTNMGLAQHAHMPVVVVGDIDRGGVFASLFGTVALLNAADQRLIAGFVINKFRGNDALLQPGIDRLSALTGRPTFGVLPWRPDVWLDSEDALDVTARPASRESAIRVGVVRMPRVSNFTDVDALGLEPDVDLCWVSDPRALSDVDLVVLPGTRATISDLAWLRSRGIDQAVQAHAAAGHPVLGICGGFQMLGHTISDPEGVEGRPGAGVEGMGLLPVSTAFGPDKVLRTHADGGYEIHHGRIETESWDDGWVRSDVAMGTMRHGSLESDATRASVLEWVAAVRGLSWRPSGVSFAAAREDRLNLLGDLAEKHLDIEALLALAHDGVPDVPLLPPGATP